MVSNILRATARLFRQFSLADPTKASAYRCQVLVIFDREREGELLWW